MIRNASHASSWYSDNKSKLNKQLDSFLEKATEEHQFPIEGVRAIIAPHAGLNYSGPTAAFAYKCIDTTKIKRIFLLGPSHHAYFDGCCLSKCDTYETPLGDLKLDKLVLDELYDTGKFGWMKQQVDEDEHSIEMHLPFTFKIFQDKIDQVKIVPILVGSISEAKERMYGELLSKYLQDEENFFIISSDFCHWGSRFRYTYYTQTNDDNYPVQLSKFHEKLITRPIYESIQELDYRGIDSLKSSFEDFQTYLKKTQNTICGRHPIAVLLAALETLSEKPGFSNQKIQCIKYDQSSRCKKYQDSSVSYASIYIQIE
ncbi:hypothetical protein MFLAVUS_003711 [Mucor flavus]|uniref:Protein MEMO1 n=1 Tax=Mucor flavus TaxID=439312 RepID=A0ABP9YTX2_9FUNG